MRVRLHQLLCTIGLSGAESQGILVDTYRLACVQEVEVHLQQVGFESAQGIIGIKAADL